MSQIVFYFLQTTSVLSFYIDVDLTLPITIMQTYLKALKVYFVE